MGEFGEYQELVLDEGLDRAVGRQTEQKLALDVFRMRWPNVSAKGGPPKSVCSEPCPMGFVKTYEVRDCFLKKKFQILTRITFFSLSFCKCSGKTDLPQ